MTGNRELSPLRIRPRPSRVLAAFLSATHGAALSVPVVLPADWYWRVGLAAMVVASLIDALGLAPDALDSDLRRRLRVRLRLRGARDGSDADALA